MTNEKYDSRLKGIAIAVFFLAIFIGFGLGGFFVAVNIITPTILPSNFLNTDPTPGTWNILQEDSLGASFLMGGNFAISIKIDNLSNYKLEYIAGNFSFFYYPIGNSIECLLFNGGLLDVNSEPALLRRIELYQTVPEDSPKDSWGVPKTLKVSLRSNSQDAQNKLEILWNVGLRIPSTQTEEITLFYQDCVKHNLLLFSVRYTQDSKTTFAESSTYFYYENLFVARCYQNITSSSLIAQTINNWPKELFKNLINDPNLVDWDSVNN